MHLSNRVRCQVKNLRMAVIAMFFPLAMSSCETIAPALMKLGLSFGQDLLAAASINYAPKYASQVESLLAVLAREVTGMKFEAQLARQGYRPPPPEYMRHQNQYPNSGPTYASSNPYGQQPPQNPYGQNPYGQPQSQNPYGQNPYGEPQPENPYGQQTQDPYGTQSQDPYGQQPRDPYGAQSQDPYGQQPQDPYGAQSQDPYGQQPQDPYSDQSLDPYGQQPQDPYSDQSLDPYGQQRQDDPYGQQTQEPYGQPQAQLPYDEPQPQDPYRPTQENPYDQQPTQDPYAQPQNPYGQQSPQASNNPYTTRGLVPIAMNVAILAQRAGTSVLQPIEDGDILRDGNGDPARGDKIKVHFSTNCDCYVYVIGVDATGYVARMYPDPDAQHKSRVDAGRVYVLPEGDEWWGLDDYQGVEQIYFVASYSRREDIEAAIEEMAAQPRITSTVNFRPVMEPALVPTTRGLVKVKAREPVVFLAASGERQEVTPSAFFAETAGGELVVSRWFNHQ